jgi:hypothetical protein
MDTVSIRGIFTTEANAEAEAIIHSKVNLVTSTGGNIRSTGNECAIGLYSLTK